MKVVAIAGVVVLCFLMYCRCITGGPGGSGAIPASRC